MNSKFLDTENLIPDGRMMIRDPTTKIGTAIQLMAVIETKGVYHVANKERNQG